MKRLFAFVSGVIFLAHPAGAQDVPAATPVSSKGDAKKGKRLFVHCKFCHNLAGAKRSHLGPSLDGLFGRKVASDEGYNRYSAALADAGFIWTEVKLNSWLEQPETFHPGGKLSVAGPRNEQNRKDLIAYLRQAPVAEAE
jgi:cytochrome c